jgi:hypothetical protein
VLEKTHHLSVADMKDMALNVQTSIAVFKSTHGEGNIVLVAEARNAMWQTSGLRLAARRR